MGFYGRAVYEYGNEKKFEKVIVEKQKRWPQEGSEQQNSVGSQDDINAWEQGSWELPIGPDSNHDTLIFKTNDPHIYIGASIDTNADKDVIAFQHGLPYFNMDLKYFEYNPISIENNTIKYTPIYIDRKGHVGVNTDYDISNYNKELIIKGTEQTFTIPNSFGIIHFNSDNTSKYETPIYHGTPYNSISAIAPSDSMFLKPGNCWLAVDNVEGNGNIRFAHRASLIREDDGTIVIRNVGINTNIQIGNQNLIIKEDLSKDECNTYISSDALYFDKAGHIIVPKEMGEKTQYQFYKFVPGSNLTWEEWQ